MSKKNRRPVKPQQPFLKTEQPGMVSPRLGLLLTGIVVMTWVGIVISQYFKVNAVTMNLSIVSVYCSLIEFPAKLGLEHLFSLARYAYPLIATAMIFFGAYTIGRKALPFITRGELNALEGSLFSISLGLWVMITAVFLLGVSGLLYRAPVVGGLIAVVLYGMYGFTAKASEAAPTPQQKKTWWKTFSGFERLWMLLGLVLGGVILVGCLSHETFYDSLVYHLAKPNFWIQNHRIMPDEAMIPTAFFPGNMNVLYGIGLLLKDETVCKLTSFGFTLLSLLTVYAMGKRFSGHTAGFLGALIFFTIPYTGLISYRSSMEMPLAFFETLAVFAFILWLIKQDNRWLVLAGINCGLGLGTKYTSLYCFASMVAVVIIDNLLEKRSFSALVKSAGTLIAVAFIASLPWWIYNYAYTGNPLYPFFRDMIGHMKPKNVYDPATNIALTGKWKEYAVEIFKAPWVVSMGTYEEAFVGPLLLLFLPFFFFFKTAWKPAKRLFLYAFLYWVVWDVGHRMYVRYYMPALPTLSLLCGIYLSEARFPAYVKKLFSVVITVVICSNLLLVMNLQKFSNNCLGAVLGLESKTDYLNRARPTYPNPYYSMAEWINANTPKTAYIALICEARSFYIQRRTIMYDISENIPFVQWANESPDADALFEKIRRKSITHFLVNLPEASRLTSFDSLSFEPRGIKVFHEFWVKYVKEIHKDIADLSIPQQGVFSMKGQQQQWWGNYSSNPRNYVYLYQILPQEEAATAHAAPPNIFLIPDIYAKDRWEKLLPVLSPPQVK